MKKDYQGNNRVVFDQSGVVEQVNHYYPYGGTFAEGLAATQQPYKFGGKELERMNGLDWSDFGARMLDSASPSWGTIDPMAEKYYSISPYTYCIGNPIRYIDPNGMNVYGVDGNGKMILLLLTNDETDKIYKVNNTTVGGEIHLSIDTNNSIDNVSKDFMNNDYSINYNNSRIDINYSKSDLSKVFSFFKDNTKVEWSHIITKNNNSRMDYIGTTHNSYGDYSGSVILQNMMFDGYHIIEANHNHTGLSFVPSIGDNKFAKEIHNIYPAALLHISIPKSVKRKTYDEFSKQELDEITITPR